MPPVSHRLFVSMDDKGHLAVVCNYAAPLLNEALSGHIMALTLCLRLVFAGRITGSVGCRRRSNLALVARRPQRIAWRLFPLLWTQSRSRFGKMTICHFYFGIGRAARGKAGRRKVPTSPSHSEGMAPSRGARTGAAAHRAAIRRISTERALAQQRRP